MNTETTHNERVVYREQPWRERAAKLDFWRVRSALLSAGYAWDDVKKMDRVEAWTEFSNLRPARSA